MQSIFLTLGIVVAAVTAFRLIAFVRLYTRGSAIGRYRREGAYALVTGATDGIGKAMAAELAAQGFNVILHGRSADKLAAVREEIQKVAPDRDVRLLIHDGATDPHPPLSSVTSLPITVLVNNVGAAFTKELSKFTTAEIDENVNLNVLFPTHITHTLLPHLARPALVINLSSWAALQPPPYLAVYCGTKAYNAAFSNSLARELDDVETIALVVASVQSAGNRGPVGFFRPTAQTFAKRVIAIVGCGRKSVTPYWPHALQAYLISWLPEWVLDPVIKQSMAAAIVQNQAPRAGNTPA